MTLPPDRIGDRDQRYEVRAKEWNGHPFVVGYASDPSHLIRAVHQHPSWHSPTVWDRWEKKDASYLTL